MDLVRAHRRQRDQPESELRQRPAALVVAVTEHGTDLGDPLVLILDPVNDRRLLRSAGFLPQGFAKARCPIRVAEARGDPIDEDRSYALAQPVSGLDRAAFLDLVEHVEQLRRDDEPDRRVTDQGKDVVLKAFDHVRRVDG